jgi:hypothetical protein
MSDPREQDGDIPPEDDNGYFAPLEKAELRGDEEFVDLPPRPDEPTGPGVDRDDLDSSEGEDDEDDEDDESRSTT